MTLRGGAADKLGNLYEACWTVRYLLYVMDEKYDSIRLEDPSPEGEGFEFSVRKEYTVEYHQVKSSDGWTIIRLARNDVLKNFSRNLRQHGVHCVFTSPDPARDLRDLAERARNSLNLDEFRERPFFTDQIEKAFRQYRQNVPGLSEQEAYEELRRIWVDNVSHRNLRDQVRDHAFTLVDGEPENVVDILAEFGMKSGVRHSELTALELWNHLESRGFTRKSWDKDPHVLSSVQTANQRYLDSFRSQIISENVLPRDEVPVVSGILRADDKKASVLLTGPAGAGKSGVIFQVVEGLLEAGLPVVAFRVDRLNTTQLPEDVGKQFGLPGSPARVLAAVARGKPCVLVIDQLDAVSMASGRNFGLFDCISEILSQAQAYDKMEILMACRKFDLDNDVRLGRLASRGCNHETVTVSGLSVETIREVVSALGLDPDKLTRRQVDLLSVPLHLKLLSNLALDEEVRALNFASANDLYDRFWQFKQQVLAERLGRPVNWARVIGSLCDYMHQRQVLSAPEALVDEWGTDAFAMSSENVLVHDSGRYSFFHEGFFDYSYARSFSASNEPLLGLLAQDEQGLFRRAQVRQILLYLREADFDRYVRDLRDVLRSSDVRFHIKQVIFTLLSDVSQPSEVEWRILSSFELEDYGKPTSRQVWSLMRRSTPWFQFVDSLALVQQWMESTDEDLVDQAVWLLSVAQHQLPDRVAELLLPYVGKSQRWNGRLQRLAQTTDWGSSRSYFELMLSLLDEGGLDDAVSPTGVNSDFWNLISYRTRSRPEWGCELIGHYLHRRRNMSLLTGQRNPFHHSSGTMPLRDTSSDIVSTCAKGAPREFVREILPFVQKVVEDTAGTEREGLELDPVWGRRAFPSGYSADSTLLGGLTTALSALAVQEPEEFIALIEPIRQSRSETLQYLVIHGFSTNGERFADEGLEHLCERPERLNVGCLSDERWTVRRLIEAAAPHASPGVLDDVGHELLGFYPDWERGESGSERQGAAQYALMTGIPDHLRSEEVTGRIGELEEKFPGEIPSPPPARTVQRVRSPISEADAAGMDDAAWLRELPKYTNERPSLLPGGEPVGGTEELSRVLEREVERDFSRFANLVTLFPDELHPAYFKAVLRALRSADLDMDTVASVCARCQRIPENTAGAEISELIAGLGGVDVPPTLLDLVGWNATEHPDPAEEMWKTANPVTGDFLFEGDPFGNGINTVRGRSARALAQLLRDEPSRLVHLESTLDTLVGDQSVAVRSCVAEVLTVMLSIDGTKAVRLFRQLCDTDDSLLQTPFVERFLFFALLGHFDELSDILERMVHSTFTEVSTAGARLACLTSLDLPDAASLAEECVNGSEFQRLGAAEVMAANLKVNAYRSVCEESLALLFDDPSPQIRVAASSWFDNFEGSGLGNFSSLVARFVESEAFVGNEFRLFRALEYSTARLAEVTLSACERFVDVAGLSASDVRTSNAGDATYVIPLILRVYRESSDDQMRTRCLDLVDRLMELGAFGIEQALEDFER